MNSKELIALASDSPLFEIARVLVRLNHVVLRKGSHARRKMKYWEIIADNLHDAGWSLGWVSAIDCEGRTIWIVDALYVRSK